MGVMGYSPRDRWHGHPSRLLSYNFYAGDRRAIWVTGATLQEAYRKAVDRLGVHPNRFNLDHFVGQLGQGNDIRKG